MTKPISEPDDGTTETAEPPALPVLRWPDADHRDLRARDGTALVRRRREVRHVMIDLCRTIRQDELQRRWSWAGDNIARQYANLTELLYPRDAS